MSYAPRRSMNGSLSDGMTDGSYKKLIRDRGGFAETTTRDNLEILSPISFAYTETTLKEQPDGTTRYSTGDVHYRSQPRHQG